MNIPTSIVNDISSSTGATMTGATPLIIILFGLGIAFFVVKNIIALLPKAKQ